LKLKNEEVALFISDQRMPEMEGIAFLEKANEIFPWPKKFCLLRIPILKLLSKRSMM
jgi:thioredoxin reductase (NADPH)